MPSTVSWRTKAKSTVVKRKAKGQKVTARNLLPANENGRCLFRRCVGRANNNANANGGLVYANSNNGSSNSHSSDGGRLAI